MEAVGAAAEHPHSGQLQCLDGDDNNNASLVGH